MAIPVPTIDDFQESTVMLVIRKIVDYIKDSLVPDINKADVANITTSISGQNLTINIVLGDGTTKSTTVVLPEGGGGESGPYPTGVTLSLTGTTLNFNMAMSNGSPITGSVDLNSLVPIATDTAVGTVKGGTYVSIGDDGTINNKTGYVEDDSSNPNVINNYVYNTNLKMYTNAPIQKVESVSGSVSENDLTITVNGVNSNAIPLPGGNGVTYKVLTSSEISKIFNTLYNSVKLNTPIMVSGNCKVNGVTYLFNFNGVKLSSDNYRYYGDGSVFKCNSQTEYECMLINYIGIANNMITLNGKKYSGTSVSNNSIQISLLDTASFTITYPEI